MHSGTLSEQIRVPPWIRRRAACSPTDSSLRLPHGLDHLAVHTIVVSSHPIVVYHNDPRPAKAPAASTKTKPPTATTAKKRQKPKRLSGGTNHSKVHDVPATTSWRSTWVPRTTGAPSRTRPGGGALGNNMVQVSGSPSSMTVRTAAIKPDPPDRLRSNGVNTRTNRLRYEIGGTAESIPTGNPTCSNGSLLTT